MVLGWDAGGLPWKFGLLPLWDYQKVYQEELERILWHRLPGWYQSPYEFESIDFLAYESFWHECSRIAQEIARRRCRFPALARLPLSRFEGIVQDNLEETTACLRPFQNAFVVTTSDGLWPRFSPPEPWCDTPTVNHSPGVWFAPARGMLTGSSFQNRHEIPLHLGLGPRLPVNYRGPDDSRLNDPVRVEDFFPAYSHIPHEHAKTGRNEPERNSFSLSTPVPPHELPPYVTNRSPHPDYDLGEDPWSRRSIGNPRCYLQKKLHPPNVRYHFESSHCYPYPRDMSQETEISRPVRFSIREPGSVSGTGNAPRDNHDQGPFYCDQPSIKPRPYRRPCRNYH